MVTAGVVTAIETLAGLVVTDVSAPVALTGATVGEAPEPLLTLVTLAAVDVGQTQALTSGHLAEVVTGTNRVTVALCNIKLQLSLYTNQ